MGNINLLTIFLTGLLTGGLTCMAVQVKFKIAGMHCMSCAMNIDGELEDTEGVKEANTNYANAHTEVVFDMDKLTKEKIVSIIKKVGYMVQSADK